ncbi:TniB family NTP-binding protein [Castellaniella ginsengisoli]|uniref:TniB family NTP-binding protein n=1 Tax=Castellaniella ginsengisoli TaxID=546114 RepID=A0AB39CJB5_9BURK
MPYTEKALTAGRQLADVIVQHAAFRDALDLIANALDMGNAVGLFAGVRVIAPSGSGKSLLIDCLQRNIIDSPYLTEPLSVIRTELKESPSVSQIQGGLLDNFGYGLTGRGRATSNNNEVHAVLVEAMRAHKVQLVVLDEFQHIFSPASEKVSTHVLDWLKRLMNISRVPVVLVGSKLMDRLEGTDRQLTSRIPSVIRLPAFQCDARWVGFLKAFAKESVAVDLSPIVGPQIALHLFRVTQGVPRELKRLLVQAVMMAIDADEKSIAPARLHAAYAIVYGPDKAAEDPFHVS